MSQDPTPIPAPKTLLIKLSDHQYRAFSGCAKMCGLDLVSWLTQCADVQAAHVIDAAQAAQRAGRPDRKKQILLQPEDEDKDENEDRPKKPKKLSAAQTEQKRATVKAARTYNKRFQRRASLVQEESDE